MIDHLSLNKKPRVLAATHYHECVTGGYLNHLESIEFFTLECFIDQGSILCLFKLVKGTASSSMGIQCAKSVGFPNDLLTRIEEISNHIKNGSPIPRHVSRSVVTKQAFAHELCGLLNENVDFKIFWSRVAQLSDYF